MRCQRPAFAQNQFLSQIPTFCMVVNLIDLRLWLKIFIFHRCLDYILLNLTPACRRLLTSTQSGATLEYRAQSDRYTWHRLTCTCIEGSSKGREHLVDPMVAKKQEKVNLQAQWKLIMVPFLCHFNQTVFTEKFFRVKNVHNRFQIWLKRHFVPNMNLKVDIGIICCVRRIFICLLNHFLQLSDLSIDYEM